MSKGRLTRQELGWLLTQEAQGAAERLRTGVELLMNTTDPPRARGEPKVDVSLDALDDAVKMLSSLHHHPVNVRGRRGRIDLAALLWEVQPDARVSIEPGSGTEVFGEEAELRRMLHVLVGPGSRTSSAVTVRREGDMVRVEVVLGPDASASSETERAWLHRMAMRHGGRYELEGALEVLALPADRAAEREEREALRRELDEARRQGEVYARELAALSGAGDEPPSSSSYPVTSATAMDRVAILVRLAGAVAAELRPGLAQVVWDLRAVTPASEHAARSAAIWRRLHEVQDFVGELGALGEIDPTEAFIDIDLVETMRTAMVATRLRAERLGVDVRLATMPDAHAARMPVRAAAGATAVLARELIAHALSATPRGRSIAIGITAPPAGPDRGSFGPRLTVDDGGSSVPPAARKPLLTLELEPATYGRPSSIPLHVCSVLAVSQGATFSLDDSPLGGVRTTVTFAH